MKVYVNATQGEFILKFGCQALKQAKTQLDEDYRQQFYELQLIEHNCYWGLCFPATFRSALADCAICGLFA